MASLLACRVPPLAVVCNLRSEARDRRLVEDALSRARR
jgi:hypothetical protein